jgi:WD40-like Beta Propeller Repeat
MRVAVFILIVGVCLAAGGLEVGRAFHRAHSFSPPAGISVAGGATLSATGQTRILFRNGIPDKSFAQLAVARVGSAASSRELSDLSCDRVYYAGGRGLCLTANGGFSSSYVAKIFDARFHILRVIKLTGIPSRSRISPDGRLGAVTVFVNGDSYAPGNFSTRTSILRMSSGQIIANLEQFTVYRDGKRFHKRNFNFWGVTFATDGDTFYATLGSGAETYLVKGSISARRMEVIHTHVECPSLSPDGTRIAFKRSINSHGAWRLYVLNLRTMREWPLAETRSVDDQAEWLDNQHVLYWRGADVWEVRADGTGEPRIVLTDASSPVVLAAS